MPGMPKDALHARIVEALDGSLDCVGHLASVPFLIKPTGLMRLAVWAFTVTSPPGGRHPLESKIQLIVPGQGKGDRGTLTPPDPDTFPVLMGVKPDDSLFVLWDAFKHDGFSYSKNVQVRAEVLIDAASLGIGRTSRELRSGTETVIVARADHLHQALHERIFT